MNNMKTTPSRSKGPQAAPMECPPTADLCDAHEDLLAAGSLRVLPPVFQNYGGETAICGPVVTLKCFEDNSHVRQLLESPGQGRDSQELLECAVGVWAIATHPKRSDRQGAGQRDIPVDMAGVVVRPGNWCYADADGILVCDKKLA
jgi:regulator of ribonuclease activity A